MAHLDYANYLKSIHEITKIPADVCNLIVKYVLDDETISNNLILSSKNGHLEVVKYLHKKGADIKDDAIILASENGHLKVVKYLHKNGADIQAKYNFAVIRASRNGYIFT